MDKTYDIIIIGGGATGSGIALDAVLRGYKTLLIEKDDFSSKASSNSTKLVHGGVRYLEKAVLQCNLKQFSLVKEALKERYYFLNNSINMSQKLPIYSVLSGLFERFYFYMGLKLYDILSFDKSLGKSQFFNAVKTQHIFPFLNNFTHGSIGFYDGTFNDMKVNISLLSSAQSLGCDIYNYHEVTSFLYDNKNINGVTVLNKLNHSTQNITAPVVINATGYYCDMLRKLDNSTCNNIITFSKGSHLVLNHKFSNKDHGIIFQKTTDNRVLFLLPWQNHTLAGTTEVVTDFTEKPSINKDEIKYLLKNINEHLNTQLTRKDILSHFSSFRPLINDQSNQKSENMVREHLILKSNSNLITITGGKWTTYRKMAQECLDFVLKHRLLEYKNPCKTLDYKLLGNEYKLHLKDLNKYSLDEDIKDHLIYHYGTKTFNLLNEFSQQEQYERFVKNYPFIKAELFYTMKYEFVQYPNDFLFRRLGLGKMNLKETQKLLSTIVDIMSTYYHWSDEKTLSIYEKSLKEINELLQAI